MKRMELVDFELAFKEAVSAHKKVGWVSVFDKFAFFIVHVIVILSEAKNPVIFSPGSFVFVLRTSLRMTAWKHPLFTF